MGAFNTLKVRQECPVCHKNVQMNIQFKYGETRQFEYELGDVLRWGGNDKGQQTHGTVVVYGTAESCPNAPQECEFEFASKFEFDYEIFVVDNTISSIRPLTEQYDLAQNCEGYIELDENGCPRDSS